MGSVEGAPKAVDLLASLIDSALYRQVTHIASLSAAGLALSLLLLLAMSIPYDGFEKLPAAAYEWLYEAMYAGTALVVVLAVGTVTLLALTIRQLIGRVAPDAE